MQSSVLSFEEKGAYLPSSKQHKQKVRKIPVELGYTICETITSWINPTSFLGYGSSGGGMLGAVQGSGKHLVLWSQAS